MTSDSPSSRDATSTVRLLVACAAALCVWNISWWLQPEIVHEVVDRFGAGESRAGLVASVEFGAMALCSTLLSRYVRNARYLTLATVGMLVAVAGATTSVFVTDYSALLVARIVTGLGEGACLMVSSAALAHLPDPDRAYGKLNIVNISLGAALTFLLPVLAQHAGSRGIVFPVLLVALLALFPLLLLMPASARQMSVTGSAATPAHREMSSRVMVLAAAVFVVAVASSAMWSFYFVIGLRVGLGPEEVARTIGLAIVSALGGGVLATVLGARFGRFGPVTLGLLAIAVAVIVISTTSNPDAFRIAACVNVAGIYFLIPYFFGFAAAEDRTGRAAAVIGASFLLTGAFGPFLGGALIEMFGAHSIAWLVVICNAAACAMFWWIDRTRSAAFASETALDPAGASS